MRLRRDAATDKDAGFIRWLPPEEVDERKDGVLGFLYLGRRSKGGINPYARTSYDATKADDRPDKVFDECEYLIGLSGQ